MDQGMEGWRDGEKCTDRRKGDEWSGDDKMENRDRMGGGEKDGHDMVAKEYNAPSYILFKRRCDRMEDWSKIG